jgi:ABC-type nitrate/sulfonate/bicarbonate transport system substrate-binding protein
MGKTPQVGTPEPSATATDASILLRDWPMLSLCGRHSFGRNASKSARRSAFELNKGLSQSYSHTHSCWFKHMALRLLFSETMKSCNPRLARSRWTPYPLRISKQSGPLQVGFLPENDCAPIVVAQEFGLYRKYDVSVELHHEASWNRIHDKIVHRQLEAAHAPAALPFLINLGLTPEKCECLSGLVLSLEGNAITVSRDLWEQGMHDGIHVRDQIVRSRGRRTFTFGVGSAFSPQYFLLCQWLRTGAIAPHVDVRIAMVPPVQMFPMLKLGYLDGYCAGEPWTSVAVQAGVGVCVSTSATLAPLHPEKSLMVRQDFAEERADEHERLIAALIEACALCDQVETRQLLPALLSQPQFVNAPAECLEPGLLGRPDPGEHQVQALHGLNIFHRGGANEPAAARAKWITSRLYNFLRWRSRPPGIDRVFRRDIFLRGRRRASNFNNQIPQKGQDLSDQVVVAR